jgi:hypothetical protein
MKNLLLLFSVITITFSCQSANDTIYLFNNPAKWKGNTGDLFANGVLRTDSEFQTLVYNPGLLNTFTNFEMKCEVMTHPGGIANILFHTNKRYLEQGYEIRIDNSPVGDWDKLLKTGSLSSVRNAYYNSVQDDTWFNLSLRVVENHILIKINGLPVVDYIEPEVPFRTSETEGRKLNGGTFAIRTGFGNRGVEFRNMTVKKLERGEKMQNEDANFVRKITELHSRNLPVVDYHVHEKGDLNMQMLIERSAKLGINYGVAANCGLKFPIQTNEELAAYHESIEGLPIFKAMQAEGREWVDIFLPEYVSKFDYAFTDAMTWTNDRGKRMRLWIPEETEVGDPQDFMVQLVAQIEKVVSEPIAIYVNPTYLPNEIADQYDELWTDERIDRVVNALVENDVALEINSRTNLPGERIIKKAKDAGVKFAMGTNNTSSDNLGKLDWAIQMIEKYNIQPSDMYLPSPEPFWSGGIEKAKLHGASEL